MQYMGSKRRFKKYILPIILENRDSSTPFIDMFVGGANIIDGVKGGLRIGNDIHTPLISMWKALQRGWKPPLYVTKDEYYEIKKSKNVPLYLKAYVGFNSFGSKYFGGYPNSSPTDWSRSSLQYWQHHRNFVMRQVPKLRDVKFTNYNYKYFPLHKIKEKSIVYCDIPYKGTVSYSVKTLGKNKKVFNHDEFFDWVREATSKYGHKFYISEYTAPSDFKCIWSKEAKVTVDVRTNNKISIEKLFILK